jgi:hypothetical protein
MSTPSTGPGSQGFLRTPLSRRQFLTGSAAVSLAAVMAGKTGAVEDLVRDLDPDTAPRLTQSSSQTFKFSVARDADLALLDITFINFDAVFSGSLITALKSVSASSIITVRLPPQAVGEAAYNIAAVEPGTPPGDWLVDPPPVLSGVSGPSLLCFNLYPPSNGPDQPRIGHGTPQVTFSSPMAASDLLDWSAWTLLVPAAAVGPVKTALTPTDPRKSTTPVTYIEYPYAMLLSPATDSAYTTQFVARTPPNPLVSPSKVSDLWITSLQQVANSGDAVVAQVAAVWATDYGSSTSATGPTAGSSQELIAYGE